MSASVVPFEASAGKTDAKKLLTTRLGEAGRGKLLPSEVANTTFENLKNLISDDYAKNELRSADQLKVVLKRLTDGFAGMKATEITAARISAYQAERHHHVRCFARRPRFGCSWPLASCGDARSGYRLLPLTAQVRNHGAGAR